ncbi:MAG TPA: cytochrome P450 [Myxococcota bacterium]|nr:cytochrome P450 [Myxococcota bacterium]
MLDVNFLDSANWDASMPERLRWLREHDPIYWSEASSCWVLAKYHDVSEVSKDQERFTSALGVRANNPVKLGLIDEAEPRHTELRKLINKGFTPRMVRLWEEKFEILCDEVLSAIGPRGECDFVCDVAVPLPLLLIAEMMGIHREARERFHHWSDAMIAGDGNFHRPEIMIKAAQAYMEYSHYLTGIIEERRREPHEDLVSILVGAKDAGLLKHYNEDPTLFADDQIELANDELIKLLVILLVAGNETTRNAISGGMQLLIEHPEVRRALIADPDRIPVAVEEMLRLVSPVHTFSRTVTRDTTLRGKTLREGQKVLLVYPSANRDAEVFPEPDRFDIEREPHHVAFGVGSHFCLGANLARMEMRVAFREILRRLPDMEYTSGGPEFRPSALVRSCVRFPVRFTPERRAA